MPGSFYNWNKSHDKKFKNLSFVSYEELHTFTNRWLRSLGTNVERENKQFSSGDYGIIATEFKHFEQKHFKMSKYGPKPLRVVCLQDPPLAEPFRISCELVLKDTCRVTGLNSASTKKLFEAAELMKNMVHGGMAQVTGSSSSEQVQVVETVKVLDSQSFIERWGLEWMD